jgi:hypothetical protein
MYGLIAPSKDGWLVGASSDGENLVLGADGVPYLKIAPDGTITRMNGARIVGPIKANVSGAGVSIGDNVAGTVASITLPANTLRRPGDRVMIHVLAGGDGGGTILAEVKLNGVMLIDPSFSDALPTLIDISVYYVDATHAHFSSSLGPVSMVNQAGFDFAADQTIAVTQDQVADTSVLVYAMSVDVFQGAM